LTAVLLPKPYQLIVEGEDDKFSVVSLMKAHIDWPEKKERAPVWIESGGGVDKILEPQYLTVKLKTPGLRALGVMLDADAKPQSRYESIRNGCTARFPELPREMPVGGLVSESTDQQRFGVWIMPDNVSEGCLENFLRFLVPDESEPLWMHAVESVARAKAMGARGHAEKASLYTWLAWQDPPGQSPGRALTQKILNPHANRALAFVTWFRRLYQL
jgi:hypothetical protein